MAPPSSAVDVEFPPTDAGIDETTSLLASTLVPQSSEINQDAIAAERASWSRRSWGRRPTVWWPIMLAALYGLSLGMTLSPRVELITMLACAQHKPEYITSTHDSKLILIVAERVGEKCLKDPVVLAAVAKFMTISTAITGMLGCMTVVSWGAASDRLGRKRIIAITGLGVLSQDANLIFTTLFQKRLPGGYWFLLLSAIVEGVFGGASLAAANTAATAYISDCADPSSLAGVLSTFLGFMLSAAAIGPTLGGLLLRLFGKDPFYVFYVAAALDFSFIIFALILLPESLTSTQLKLARQAYAERLASAKESTRRINFRERLINFGRWLATFVTPLAIFLPAQSGSGKDWSLTVTIMSYFSTLVITGASQYKLQYLYARYGWTSEEGGYFISVTVGVRSVFLTVILPLIIKRLKHKPRKFTAYQEEHLSFLTPEHADQNDTAESPTAARSNHTSTAQLDHKISLASLALETIVFAVLPLAPTSIAFIAIAGIGSLGSGYQPAMQSLILILHSRRQSTDGGPGGEVENAGEVFGSLSIIETLALGITGPALFGVIFMNTVKVFPAAIFAASAACFALSFVFLSLVKVAQVEKRQVI